MPAIPQMTNHRTGRTGASSPQELQQLVGLRRTLTLKHSADTQVCLHERPKSTSAAWGSGFQLLTWFSRFMSLEPVYLRLYGVILNFLEQQLGF